MLGTFWGITSGLLDFDTNKTLPVENYTIKIVFVNSVIGKVNYTESETTVVEEGML